jgi:transposase
LLTDSAGRPLAIEVFEGNTSDQATVMQKINDMRQEFKIDNMIFIGDRGMITRARREDLNADEYESVKYISALKRKEFFDFLEDQNHPLQPSLFDRHKLVEVTYEGIRYVLSFNPEKEEEDQNTRRRLLQKTQEKLEMIKRNVDSGRLKNEQVIGRKIYRWVNKWNMEKFFNIEYAEGKFSFTRNEEKIKEYESIDGFYVITSDVSEKNLETKELRERYKSLIQVEQAFRTMKTTDIFIRPIRHWNPERVKGHVFLCMLSYLIIWEAGNIFADFISSTSPGEDAEQDDCHSLRIIWERLNRDVKIAKIKNK